MRTRSEAAVRAAVAVLAIAVVLLGAGPRPAAAQFGATVITQITGRPTGDLSSVLNGLTVTIVSTTADGAGEIVPRMVIRGDNGVEIRTPDDFNPGEPYPIDVFQGMPAVLQGMDLTAYFDPGALLFTGMTAADYFEGGLPPGTYQVCFQARCPAWLCGSEIVYSPVPPAGCSNSFTITEAQPPHLISPPCGRKIAAPSLQSVVFSWSPSPGADPLSTSYRLQIAEMMDPDGSPEEALEAATTPMFFDQEVFGVSSFWYGPALPLLEPGKGYAWRVIAENAELKIPFANGGASEACSFVYGDPPALWSPLLLPPTPPPGGGSGPMASGTGGWANTPWAWVKGQLRYKFVGDSAANPSAGMGGGAGLATGSLTPLLPGATYYDKGYVDPAGAKPLGGIPVKLVVKYRLLETTSMIGLIEGGPEVVLDKAELLKKGYSQASLEQIFPDIDRVVAATMTASDGSFAFQFIHDTDFGVFAENFGASPSYAPGTQTGSGPVISSIGAKKVTRTLRVVVDSPYYCSPDTDILVDPWQTADVGTMVSYVKSYRYLVGIEASSFAKNQAATGPMAGVTVSLLRKGGKPAHVPADEGDPSVHGNLTIGPNNYRVVARGTTNAKGEVLFQRLVAPLSIPDSYWYYAETPKAKGQYNYKPYLAFDSGPLSAIHNLGIVFNHELSPEPTRTHKSYLTPDLPRIAARTMDKSHDVPIEKAMVVLESKYKASNGGGWIPVPQLKTTYLFGSSDPHGYTYFEKLDVEEDGSGALVGPDRTLSAGKSGYSSWATHLGILARGKQEIREINLDPDGLILAAVRDKETKAPVPARGNFQGGINVTTIPWTLGGTTSQVLFLKVPSGKGQALDIVPLDADYVPETFTVDVKTKGQLTTLGPFEVTRKRHRITLQVVRNPPPGSIASPLPLPGATVTLLNMTRTTDKNGTARFVFDNNSEWFAARIEPPAQVDCIAMVYPIHNQPSKSEVIYHPKLEPATRIHGWVTVGDSIPVENARVFVDNGSGPGVIPIETYTADDGTFTLRNIPLQPADVSVHAAKSSQAATYVGASKTVTVPTQEQVVLDLTVYSDMDITHVLGFPVEISALQETAGGVTIDGAFAGLPSNAAVVLDDPTLRLPFGGVALKAGAQNNAQGVPYAVPQKVPVATSVPALAVKVFSAFDAELTPATGGVVVVDDAGGGKGEVRGRVRILDQAFSFSKNEAALPPLHLTPFGGTAPTVAAFRADPAAAPAKQFGVAADVPGLPYKLYGFPATATPSQCRLEADSLVIPTVLHADPGKGSPLPVTIDAGDVVLRPAAVGPVGGTGAVSVALEKWKVTAAGWQLGKSTNGIHFAAADLATGAVNVPLEGLHILPTDLSVDKAKLDALTLAGVVPLDVKTDLAQFGYDPKVGADQTGHWKLSLLPQGSGPAASLKGLPGMKAGTELALEKVSLLSSGEQLLTFPPGAPPIPFYDVFEFRPGTLSSFTGFFQLSGTVDLGVPRLSSSYQAILTFSRPSGVIEMKLDAIPFQFTGPGKVQFIAAQTAGAQTLDATGFHAAGQLVSSEGVKLKTTLHRTVPETRIDVDPLGQTLPIGGSSTWLSAVTGAMTVDPAVSDWSKFVFAGDLQGVNGMTGDTRKTFTIHGDITADGQGAQVKNMPTPFGNLAMTYDYPNARMTGNLQIDQSYGPVALQGVANLLIDGSGWYFLSGGDATMPGFGNLQAGILIGDYAAMPATVSQTLMQFAYDKSVPPGFRNGISGFFVTGRKDLPQFSVPEIGFNLGAVSAHLGGDTGLDGRLWMDFAGPGTELGIGGMAFINAYFIASSITCTELSGQASAELGAQGIINPGTGQYDLKGCGSVTVGGSIEQCVPTPSLSGISCEFCTGISVSKSLAVNLTMGTSGMDANLSLGSCSGNAPPLETGW